ncbi:MAG: helix-turn-helix domain-containing protein [Thiobacillus sp.]
MGQHYKHLNESDRACIMLRLRDGWSSRAIGRELHRSPSSITREIAKHHTMAATPSSPRGGARQHARPHGPFYPAAPAQA